MESGATKYCTNCKRDIAEGNFIMHEVHCRRNITLCKDCHEPVPRSEMEEHFEEYHKPVTCKCGETLEISKVEEHEKNDCAQRIMHCEYCELDLPFIQMAEHVNYCGSRTECCPKCQRYIQNRDRDQHDITECAFPEQKPSVPRQPPTMGSLFDDLEGYDETTYHSVANRFAVPEYVDPNDLLDESVARPSVRNVNLTSSLFYRGSKDNGSGAQDANSGGRNRRQRKNQDRVQNIYKNTNQRKPVASKKKDSTKQSNTLAADQMEADRLLALSISNEDDAGLAQETTNNLDAPFSNHGNRDFDESELDLWDNDRDLGSPSRRRLNSQVSQSSIWDALDDDVTPGEVVMAPCEFCNKGFPLEDLILHQSGCQIESLDHILDPSPLTSVPSNNQQQTVPQGSAPAQTPVLDNLRRPNLQRLISPEPNPYYHAGSSDEGSVMLPCEFCGALLPCEFLPHHQFHCGESLPARSNQEVESALQDLSEAPPSPTLVTRSAGGARSTIGTLSSSTPPKSRNSSRRQEDVMLRNRFPSSGLDEADGEGKNRQSSKVKRSLGQADDVSGRAQYSRPSKNKNSNRSGKSGGVKENDVDDYLANDVHYVGSHYTGTSLPLKASNKQPRTKPVSKKFTNSDYANDNLSPNTTSKSNTAAARTLNNNNKKRTERQDSFHEPLSQFDNDAVLTREDRGFVGSVKKANSGKPPNKGTFNTERMAGATGYVPSFVTDSNRMKKTTNSNSVRLAASFAVPTDSVTRVPFGNGAGLEPGISSGISSRPRGSTNKTSAKTRAKATRRPSSPS